MVLAYFMISAVYLITRRTNRLLLISVYQLIKSDLIQVVEKNHAKRKAEFHQFLMLNY